MLLPAFLIFFFFNDTATTEIYTLSLHDALPISFVFKYNFLSFGRWMPYWDLGLGMLWTNLAPRIPEQSTPFNFVMESGPGVQYFATERVALTLGVRFHHISNAGLGDRNKGLNSTLGYLGLSVFFPR